MAGPRQNPPVDLCRWRMGTCHAARQHYRIPIPDDNGAISDDSLIYYMGLKVAGQCKAMGIHINFAPVVDINSNAANPVIHMRSFGENREDVARKGIMYMKGMQDGGLIVTAKHFPGHGDTDADSHSTLPLISHTKERLDSVESYPFRKLIDAGLDGIMIAHLNVPALETNPGLLLLYPDRSSQIIFGMNSIQWIDCNRRPGYERCHTECAAWRYRSHGFACRG